MKDYPYFTALGFCSNDFLSFLPEIPLDNKVKILKHIVQGGGPAATSAVAAARLGVPAAFIGAVGDDDPGKWILRDFGKEGVETRGIAVRRGCSSAIAYCWIDSRNGKRSVAWTQGDLKELAPEEIDMELVRNSKVLHLDGHHAEAALAAAREAYVDVYQKFNSHVKSLGLIAELHSCGKNDLVVPAYIESGFEFWNGMYMNDKRHLFELYGDKFVFGVDPPAVADDMKASDEDLYAGAKEFCEFYIRDGKCHVVGNMMRKNPLFVEAVYRISRQMLNP